MKREFVFEKRWARILILFGVFIGLEALILPQQLKFLRTGGFGDWAILQAMLLPIGIGLCWPFVKQRFIRYFDDGISYIKFFKRRFIRWDEVVEVLDLEAEYYPIILKSKTASVRIFSSEYKDKKEFQEFVRRMVIESRSQTNGDQS